MKPEPCNRIIARGYGFRYHCSYIKGGCPIHDRKIGGSPLPPVQEPEALLPPTGTTTPAPPALSLFEAV